MSSSAIQVAKTATYLPDLVEVQRASFKWFLDLGLIEELESFSPITDYTGKLELHFIGSEYRLKRPRHDVEEAKRRDATFASQMYVTCRLVNKETGEIKEQEVFIGELPLMMNVPRSVISGSSPMKTSCSLISPVSLLTRRQVTYICDAKVASRRLASSTSWRGRFRRYSLPTK